MPDAVIVDELHLTGRGPAGLPAAGREAVRAALADAVFLARLAESVRAAFRAHPSLAAATVSLSR